MRKKFSFTLLEVLISLSLLSLILAFLFFSYRQISFEKRDLTNILEPLLEERYCDMRLSEILCKIKKEKETLFFTKEREPNSLVFIFDHKTHINPELSDAILACLYHDLENATLCLSIWPHPDSKKKEPSETFTLLEDVTDLSFSFYNPPERSKKIVDPHEVGDLKPLPLWQDQWKKEYKALPAMIKILVWRKTPHLKRDEPICFVYNIEEGLKPIVYQRGFG
jgi:type II secretory pathway component PulJ